MLALAFKDKWSYTFGMDDFRAILVKWPSLETLAGDVDATEAAVRKWHQRNTIPSDYWLSVEWAAKRRNIEGVTITVLAELARRRKAA